MWKWLQSFRSKRSDPASRRPFDEFGDLGLSTQAKADIDRLRETKGWGVQPSRAPAGTDRHSFGSTNSGMSANVVRPLARQWQGTQ